VGKRRDGLYSEGRMHEEAGIKLALFLKKEVV